jgi:hypothetical protein
MVAGLASPSCSSPLMHALKIHSTPTVLRELQSGISSLNIRGPTKLVGVERMCPPLIACLLGTFRSSD